MDSGGTRKDIHAVCETAGRAVLFSTVIPPPHRPLFPVLSVSIYSPERMEAKEQGQKRKGVGLPASTTGCFYNNLNRFTLMGRIKESYLPLGI